MIPCPISFWSMSYYLFHVSSYWRLFAALCLVGVVNLFEWGDNANFKLQNWPPKSVNLKSWLVFKPRIVRSGKWYSRSDSFQNRELKTGIRNLTKMICFAFIWSLKLLTQLHAQEHVVMQSLSMIHWLCKHPKRIQCRLAST